MQHTQPFAEVLEAVDQLSTEEQETLVAIVRRRMAERGRKRLAADVQEARANSKKVAAEPRPWTN